MAQQQLERSIQEVWALFRETDKRFNTMSEETNKKFNTMSEETDKKIKELANIVNQLTGKWGRFVEGLVAPAAVKMFRERGIEVRWTSTRNRVRKDGEEMEIDVLLENDEYVVAIEVKSTLSVEDVNEHIRKLERFKEFLPRFEKHRILGAVAGIVIEENADKYAYRKGLFVITQTGETVMILNDEKFKPKEW